MDYFPYVWGFVFWLRQHRLYPLCLSVSVFVRVFAWLCYFPTRMNTSNICLRVYGFKEKLHRLLRNRTWVSGLGPELEEVDG